MGQCHPLLRRGQPQPALTAAAPSGSPCLGVPEDASRSHPVLPACPPPQASPHSAPLIPVQGSICTPALSLSLPVPTSFPPAPVFPILAGCPSLSLPHWSSPAPSFRLGVFRSRHPPPSLIASPSLQR